MISKRAFLDPWISSVNVEVCIQMQNIDKLAQLA